MAEQPIDPEVEVWIPAPAKAHAADFRVLTSFPLRRLDDAAVGADDAEANVAVAFGDFGTEPVKLKRSELESKVREMAELLSGLAGAVHLPGVRPDSVTFSFTVGNDGLLKWTMGVKLEGSASITFKFDAANGAPG